MTRDHSQNTPENEYLQIALEDHKKYAPKII